MSDAPSPLDLAVEAAMETISMTPGITGLRPCGTSPSGTDTAVGVAFTGWTAAMRRTQMEWRLVAPTGPMPDGADPTAEFIGDALALQYGELLVLQVQRSRLAAAHGLGSYADERLSPNHMLIDASAARLLADARVDPGSIVVWHRRNSNDDGDRRTTLAKGTYATGRIAIPTVAIGTMPPGAPDADAALLVPEIAIGRPGGTPATLRDREVAVLASIPESLLIACAGKRLGDVVETGCAHIDDRAIETAFGTGATSRFQLERHRMTIEEAKALRASVPPGRRNSP